jgi:hypothetical protein
LIAMRRRLVVSQLVLVAALLTVQAGGAADVQTSAQYVRNAIPAIEAYAADHGGYKGMTIAKIRKWDSLIRKIAIRSATRRSYCIQSTTRPVAHKAGPGAAVRTGRCGVKGNPVPYTPKPSTDPQPTTAEDRIRKAIPAIEAFAADHNGYAGMTIAELRKYDAGITGITIVRASREAYCVESGAGSEQFHRNGPGEPTAPGSCPAAGG